MRNYIALIGKKSKDPDERAGYYGERLALPAQALGLNTCWVAMSFRRGTAKKNCAVEKDEKPVCVPALGYGETQGVPHPSKTIEQVCDGGEMPEWFRNGITAALLAPTAMNQQKFFFRRNGNVVSAEAKGGILTAVDPGIVKYHFEIGAGRENFVWA